MKRWAPLFVAVGALCCTPDLFFPPSYSSSQHLPRPQPHPTPSAITQPSPDPALEAEIRASWEQKQQAAERQRAAEMQEGIRVRDSLAEQNAREEKEANRNQCAESRPSRLKDVQAQVRSWRAFIQRMQPHMGWIKAHCKVEDTRGILVQHEHTSEGVIIRTREVGAEEEAHCTGAMPKGVTQPDVAALLMNTGDERLYDGEYVDENQGCADADREAGFDMFVTLTDFEGQKALLKRVLTPK